MSDIGNCPFCGGTDVSDGEILSAKVGDESHYTQSECLTCGAVGPEARLEPGEVDYGCVKAIAAWNRRASDVLAAEAREAAERIVRAHEGVEKAKTEQHPSFKDAVRSLAYHELHASAREGALIVARALLAKVKKP